jgi:RNA polymerase sigma-70 factor (ECF subfamily)
MIAIESKTLKELKKGDHAAFEKVFERYSKQPYLFSLSYLKSKDAAEDIVQEVFLKIWNNRESIKTDTSFQSYLFTIALNAVRLHFNKISRLNVV